MHILGLWKSNGNGSASHHRWISQIVKAVCFSAIHRQCKKSGATLCWATRRTSKWRSNHTRKRKLWKAGQRIDRVQEETIASCDRGDLLAKVFPSDHKHCYDTRHDEPCIARAPRTRGQWWLSWWQLSRARGDASAARPGAAGSISNPGSNGKAPEHDYPNRKVFIPRPGRGPKSHIVYGPPSLTRRYCLCTTQCVGTSSCMPIRQIVGCRPKSQLDWAPTRPSIFAVGYHKGTYYSANFDREVDLIQTCISKTRHFTIQACLKSTALSK